MNKYEVFSEAISITLAIQIAQLLADGNWHDEKRLKSISAAIDIIPILRKTTRFSRGGVTIAQMSQDSAIPFGEPIFPILKLPSDQ